MMRKGIRIFLAAALTAAAVNANAQFGVNVGYVNSKFYEKNVDHKALNGFRAGINYDIGLVAGLSLRPGVNYTFIADGKKDSGAGFDYTTTKHDHFLAVPLDIKYAFEISDDFKVYAFGGPRFDVGIASIAKSKLSGNMINGEISYDAYTNKLSSDDLPPAVVDFMNNILAYSDGLSRFDVKLGVGAGVQFKSFQLEFGYDWGMLNAYKGDYADDHTMKRNQVYVNVGVTF